MNNANKLAEKIFSKDKMQEYVKNVIDRYHDIQNFKKVELDENF
jgi:hypothetical protein